MTLKASRTLSKINDISGILAAVDNDFDVPDWGWCLWWHYGWSANALRELCLKFGWILLSLIASRTLSKMDDIAGGLEDAGRSWLELVSLIMIGICPWRSLESLFQFSWSSDDWKLRYVELKLRSAQFCMKCMMTCILKHSCMTYMLTCILKHSCMKWMMTCILQHSCMKYMLTCILQHSCMKCNDMHFTA